MGLWRVVALSEEHGAGDFDTLAIDPAVVLREERGDHGADVVGRPLEGLRDSLITLIRKHQQKEALDVDALLYSSEQLRARKLERYAQMERAVYEALCQRESGGGKRKTLRLTRWWGWGRSGWRWSGGERRRGGGISRSISKRSLSG